MVILAIDSGADAGWARFENRRLVACGLNGRPPTDNLTRVVIERPHSGKTPARLKDVITLAIRAGEWGGRVQFQTGVVPEYVEPSTWKGSTPKDISHARIWAKLDDREKAVVDAAGRGLAPSKRHNMVDAVGLGLWGVKR